MWLFHIALVEVGNMLHAAMMDLQPGLIRLLARAGREWWPVYLSLGKQWSAQLWSAASNPQTS